MYDRRRYDERPPTSWSQAIIVISILICLTVLIVVASGLSW